MRNAFFATLLFIALPAIGQKPAIVQQDSTQTTKSATKESPFSTGFYPLGFFDVDLRYFVKYNNYEAFRFGFGGITNDKLFENFKIGGHIAYGIKDKDFKYSLGGNYRINKEHNTWVDLYYINDISEIASYKYLTDARVYSVFEPRLVNITQFYKHRTWKVSVQHEFNSKVLGEMRLSRIKIDQIENYRFLLDNITFKNYHLAEATASIRISPKSKFFTTDDGRVEYFDGFPKISAQITQGVAGIAKSDFTYTKFALKLDYYIKRTNLSSTNFVLEGNFALGEVPLTHLYHAYPNSPTKDEILQRFSVAGVRSFETMYFGEFFSDRITTLQAKHSLRRFNFSKKVKPELVFISRHALGNLSNKNRHLGFEFGTLDQLYNETGFEFNKLIFGFGLSFAYRYGFYNLPDFEDNVSFKFTFNLKV